MKTIITILFTLFFTVGASAQDYKHIYQQQKALAKYTQKSLKAKANKDARKASRKMEKEGWQPMPGKLPLEKQLDRLYNAQVELGDNGTLKYIVGIGVATGSSFSGAQIAASTSAKENIASNMGSSLTSLLEENIESQQFTTTEAATIHEISDKSKQIFSQNLGMTDVMLEAYRTLSNGNIEVQTAVVYNAGDIKKIAQDTVKKEFKEKGLQTATLDEKLGW